MGPCLQAMLNRLADDGDVTPLHRFQRESDSFNLSTPFLSASAPRFGGSGHLGRPPQLMLPEDSLASMTQAMSPTRALVESALAFTVQAIRYGMFYGDDGKSITVRHFVDVDDLCHFPLRHGLRSKLDHWDSLVHGSGKGRSI